MCLLPPSPLLLPFLFQCCKTQLTSKKQIHFFFQCLLDILHLVNDWLEQQQGQECFMLWALTNWVVSRLEKQEEMGKSTAIISQGV